MYVDHRAINIIIVSMHVVKKKTMDYSLFLNLAPMSLGQYLEYIARCVLVMPCAMRKGSKGSIGLTNSSPWRHSRNVVCQLGLPFCHSDLSWCLAYDISWEMYLLKNTHGDTHTGPTRELNADFCLSLVFNRCQIIGVYFQIK